MSLFFCLVLVLVVQLAVRANQRATERSLIAQQAKLQEKIKNADGELDYMDTQDYLDEYILKNWHLVKDALKSK